jgi:hypothetical protein
MSRLLKEKRIKISFMPKTEREKMVQQHQSKGWAARILGGQPTRLQEVFFWLIRRINTVENKSQKNRFA